MLNIIPVTYRPYLSLLIFLIYALIFALTLIRSTSYIFRTERNRSLSPGERHRLTERHYRIINTAASALQLYILITFILGVLFLKILDSIIITICCEIIYFYHRAYYH